MVLEKITQGDLGARELNGLEELGGRFCGGHGPFDHTRVGARVEFCHERVRRNAGAAMPQASDELVKGAIDGGAARARPSAPCAGPAGP